LVELLAEVVVLDGQDVHGAGEYFAGGAVVVPFVSEFVDPCFQQGDLAVGFGFAFGHAVACSAFGVELVFEVGVLVGEFVPFHACLVGEGDDVQVAG
jgi:hypothetical protein